MTTFKLNHALPEHVTLDDWIIIGKCGEPQIDIKLSKISKDRKTVTGELVEFTEKLEKTI